jgi:hypothetical protein
MLLGLDATDRYADVFSALHACAAFFLLLFIYIITLFFYLSLFLNFYFIETGCISPSLHHLRSLSHYFDFFSVCKQGNVPKDAVPVEPLQGPAPPLTMKKPTGNASKGGRGSWIPPDIIKSQIVIGGNLIRLSPI